MALSRADKMLLELGIRLERNGSKSEWRVATDRENSTQDEPVESTENDLNYSVTYFNPEIADKENSPTLLDEDSNEKGNNLETSAIPNRINVASVDFDNQSRSDPSSDSCRTTSDSSDCSSNSDFSSDDSVEDPNYRTSSSSSESEDQVRVNSRARDVETVEVNQGETNLQLHEILEQAGSKKKTRKRKAQPSTWMKNQTKRLRNSGKSYRSYKSKLEVPARSIKVPCDIQKCRQKCTSKFTEEERLTIFESFWSLADIAKQRNYIGSLMEKVNAGKEGGRFNNNGFYFPKSGTKIRVCKVFFISTLGITNRCIRTIISKRQEGLMGDDLRGSHKNHKQVHEDIKSRIRKHISSIPTIESHYIRAHSEKRYIEGGKTIAQLYRDYKGDCQREKQPVSKFSMYRDIFNHEFNIAFFIPKKDQCQLCVSYQNSSEGEKTQIEEQYARHQEEKTFSREEKLRDKSMISPDYQVACFDLQASLPTPNGQVSSFYYRSKLATYNFTVCHLDKKGQGDVFCYMWHEGEGKRGATEIGTCLLDFLKKSAEKANSENLEMVLYSDNCAGQQKNKFVLAAFLYAVTNYKIKSITHKFLVTGHTQNEGDNVHSLIEKNIKRALKSGPIYTPAQYVTLVQTAKKSGTPFKVIEYTHEDFLDLKNLTERAISNLNTNSEGEVFKLSEVSILKVEKASLSSFFYKTSFKEADFKSVNLFKVKRTRKNNLNSITCFEGIGIENAYKDPIPISKKKYEDLMYLVRSNAIIKSHSDFYTHLHFTGN